jgi:ATP-dependent Clp protease adaptor protein ClpS
VISGERARWLTSGTDSAKIWRTKGVRASSRLLPPPPMIGRHCQGTGPGPVPFGRDKRSGPQFVAYAPRPLPMSRTRTYLADVRMGDDDRIRRGDEGSATGIATRVKPQTKRPSLYRVLLLNDDYTPMEFVVHVVERFFNKSREEATQIMLHVHQHGVGECGIFTYEVAETKVTQVMDFARKHQHPLQCVMEKK